MTARSAILFQSQKAAPFLRAQWTAKGAAQPLTTDVILEPDLSAKPFFRSLWRLAFPARDPLPFGALANKDGTGTGQFWDVFA